MLSSAYKKFANENGLKIKHGIAYGMLNNYAVLLFEGIGWKGISVGCKLSDENVLTLQSIIKDVDFRKKFRINSFNVSKYKVCIKLVDTIGTMNNFYNLNSWLFPTLDNLNATKANICPYCDTELDFGNKWIQADDVVYHIHESCINKIIPKEEDKINASYLKGFIGAFIGALIGIIPHTLIYIFWGRLTYYLGLLIGFLANKGYMIANGKNGKMKVPILLLVMIIVVIFFPFIGVVIYTAVEAKKVYQSVDLLKIVSYYLNEKNFLIGYLADMGISLVFAIGGFALMIIDKKIGPKTVKDLE